MANIKFDGVIEAVRYTPEDKIEVVRAYERRGATFSDRVLILRSVLIEQLKKGERFYTGQRKEYLASTFETAKKVQVVGKKGNEIIATDPQSHRDLLEGVPLF